MQILSKSVVSLGVLFLTLSAAANTPLADQQPNLHWHWPDAQLPIGESGTFSPPGPPGPKPSLTLDGRDGMVKSIFAPVRSTRLNFELDGEMLFSIFRNRNSTYAVELAPGILWDEAGRRFWEFVVAFGPAQQLKGD